MRLLVLGGSGFVGRAFVEDALDRGWDVTTFNRGTHAAPPGVLALVGDRSEPGGLAALDSGVWDVVVDTWSAAPSVVRDAARLLAGRARTYLYVSSRSVHPWPLPAGSDEQAAVTEASVDDGADVEYGRGKAGGELAAVESFGPHALLLRAGLILGPYENIGRLPWWLLRVARGGDVAAPGPADLPLQYIDARDLASWGLDAAAAGLGGPYNTVSPPGYATTRSLLETCLDVTGSSARLRWIDPDVVLAAGVEPWTDLPVWLPPGESHDAMHGGDVSKAVAAGLTFRPLRDTVADTWAWLQSIGGVPPHRADRPSVGIDPAAEARLLASTPAD